MTETLPTNSKDEIFNAVFNRISGFSRDLNRNFVDVQSISTKVMQGIRRDISDFELYNLTSEICASLIAKHTDHGVLAARLLTSLVHSQTHSSFCQVVQDLYNHKNPVNGRHSPLISESVRRIVSTHGAFLERAIDYSRDYELSYFAIKTLQKSYLLKMHGEIYERPQHLLMRVALGIHANDKPDDDHSNIEAALETYELISRRCCTHASPTLMNAGTRHAQMCSSFLMSITDYTQTDDDSDDDDGDSVECIRDEMDALKQFAQISKGAGGVGLAAHRIPAPRLVPLLRVFNHTSRYVDMGGHKRAAVCAVYVEPWHAEFTEFLELKLNQGVACHSRARDLFYAVWMPDLFMRRVQANATWTLLEGRRCSGLTRCWGVEFDRLYERYERDASRVCRVVRAQELWARIVRSQTEAGTPYIVYKDAVNHASNHQHLGAIQCASATADVVQFVGGGGGGETASCSLASVCLSRFVVKTRVGDDVGDDDEFSVRRDFDYTKLIHTVATLTRNLNKIIDSNVYPSEEARAYALRHRPIGIGVQGLADCFAEMRVEWESEAASYLNRRIFATIYYAALRASCDLARDTGSAYPSYAGSPLSRGLIHPDLLRQKMMREGGGWSSEHDNDYRGQLDWRGLRADLAKYGAKNSLLTALTPTASTAQIMGENESFEPFTSNAYVRRVLCGEFQVVNRYLMQDLERLSLWDEAGRMKNLVLANHGSIQNISEIPDPETTLQNSLGNTAKAFD